MRRVTKKAAIVMMVGASFSLGGCAGGGGVASTPTPTPTPAPTPTANLSLNPLTASESFKNDAVMAAVSGTNGVWVDAPVSSATLTVSYDKATNSYTVASGGQSQTFGPASLLPSNPSGAVIGNTIVPTASAITSSFSVYDKSQSATSVNTLILSSNTHAISQINNFGITPTDGAASLVFTYSGYGEWLTGNLSGSSMAGNVYYFTYGVATPDAATPRAGSANYKFDLDAKIFGQSSYVAYLNGNGVLNANFGTGAITLATTPLYVIETNVATNSTSGSYAGFSGSATISSSANSFAGTFTYTPNAIYAGPITGSLTGRFYGPNAEEVGAVFSGSFPKTSSIPGAITMTGALIGTRGTTPIH